MLPHTLEAEASSCHLLRAPLSLAAGHAEGRWAWLRLEGGLLNVCSDGLDCASFSMAGLCRPFSGAERGVRTQGQSVL